MAFGNYVSFSTTVDSGFSAEITGFTGLNLSRTSVGPDTAGLFFSTDGGTTFTQTGTTFTVGTVLSSAATDFGSTFASTPLIVEGPATIQWRIVFSGGSGNRAGIGKASTNDFSITGSTSSDSVKNLLWNGTDGDDWNYAKTNWLNTGNGNSPSKFSANDRATISTAGEVVVASSGIDVASLTVNNPSGTVTLSDGSISGISLAKSDAGTLRIDTTNTFTGGAALTGGVTEIADSGSLGEATITLAGATLRVDSTVSDFAAPLFLGAGGGTFDNAADVTLGAVANSISNNPLVKIGTGELELTAGLGTQTSGAANLNIMDGGMTFSGTAQFNLGKVVTLGADLTLVGGATMFHGSEITGTGSIVIQDAAASIIPRFEAGSVNVRVPVVLEADGTANSPNGNNTFNFYGDISGPHNFVKSGNGPATFRTDMSYTGTTTLNDKGSLTLSGAGNLGQGDVLIDNADARLVFEAAGEATVSNNISGSGAVATSVNSNSSVNLTGVLTYIGETVINARILRFDGISPDLKGGVHVLAAATPGTTGAIGGNGSIGSGVTIDENAGISSRIRDWNGAAGVGYDDLEVDFLDIAGPLVVKIDGTGLINFTESAKSFTILNTTGGISGFEPNAVSFVLKNFPGNGTFDLAESGNSLVLNYTAGVADPYKAFVTGVPYNLTGNDALPGADPDNDGIANSVEFVIGGNPANASDTGKLPTLVADGANFVFTFHRSNDSAYLNPTVQYSSTLSGWTTAVNGTDGIVIGTANPTASGLDVVVTIPKSLAVGSKLFARLNVVVP